MTRSILRRGALLLWLVALLLPLPATARGVDLDDATYSNRRAGVKLEVPDGWTLHRQTGFPALLLLLARKESSATISLATAELPPRTAMKRFIAENRAGLRAVGLRVLSSRQSTQRGKPAWRVHAQARDGAVELRQILLPRASHIFVLTLSCPVAEVEQLAFELNRLLEVLELSPPRAAVDLQPRPSDGRRSPGPGGAPGLESKPLPGGPGSPTRDTRPGAGSEGPGSRPEIDSRPSGDSGRTVDSRPNRPTSQTTRPAASQPARGTPRTKDDPPIIEDQEL